MSKGIDRETGREIHSRWATLVCLAVPVAVPELTGPLAYVITFATCLVLLALWLNAAPEPKEGASS
jgi:hypothetical protein